MRPLPYETHNVWACSICRQNAAMQYNATLRNYPIHPVVREESMTPFVAVWRVSNPREPIVVHTQRAKDRQAFLDWIVKEFPGIPVGTEINVYGVNDRGTLVWLSAHVVKAIEQPIRLELKL